MHFRNTTETNGGVGNRNVSLKYSQFRVATKRHGSSTTNEILCLCVCIYLQAINKRERSIISMCQRFSAAGMTTTGGHRMDLEITKHVLPCTGVYTRFVCSTRNRKKVKLEHRKEEETCAFLLSCLQRLTSSRAKAGSPGLGGAGCGVVKTQQQQQQGLGRRDTRVTVSGESRSKTSSRSPPRNGRESPHRKQVRDLPRPRRCTRNPNPLQE